MFAKKSALPEARIERRPRWYLKDPVFMSETGGTLAFLGLFLMICVGGQRTAERGEAPDAFTTNVFIVMLFVTYGMAVSGGIMAGLRVMIDSRPLTYFRSVAAMQTSGSISFAACAATIWGVTRLILPLQLFFAWLAMSVGFSLLFVMRGRQKAAEAKSASASRPVE